MAEIAGIPVNSVKRMKLQNEKGELVSPPAKKKHYSPILDGTDSFSKDCTRQELLVFYERGEVPTLDDLLEKVTGHQ